MLPQIHFISASCENMIDGAGMRPGDILTAANGKTVEVWCLSCSLSIYPDGVRIWEWVWCMPIKIQQLCVSFRHRGLFGTGMLLRAWNTTQMRGNSVTSFTQSSEIRNRITLSEPIGQNMGSQGVNTSAR